MEKNRVEEIKMELIDLVENGTIISIDSAQELLSLIERIYPESQLSRDTTPMIGTNPFRKSSDHGSENINILNKDINQSLNYRVQKFGNFNGNA